MTIFKRGLQPLALMLAFSGVVAGVSAQPAELIRAQSLLESPEIIAKIVKPLAAKTAVEVLERRGGWSRVRTQDGAEGWLRVLALRDTQSAGINLLALSHSGSNANSRVTGVAGIRSMPTTLAAERDSSHALILTIGAYQGGIPVLKGVVHDANSAVLMARALGVPEQNTVALSDATLTLNGMRKAMDDLDARVLPNDEVFFYYSGHGTRLQLFDGRQNRCAEALLSVDGEAFLDSELEERLQRLALKARRVVVFIDACHAGGVTTRSLGEEQQFTAKFYAKSDTGSGVCDKPVNALTRSLEIIDTEAEMGKGKSNFVHIAAARDNEAALDDGLRGGLASQAWLDCLTGRAKDLDGSTGVSIGELQACTQPGIDALAQGNSRFSSHHLTVTGNRNMVLVGPEELPSAVNPAAVLADIFANRDDRRRVRLRADKSVYKVKQDRVTFSLESSHAGYVYLLMAGSDGKSFDLLFPNKRDSRNQIKANEVWQLPRAGWAFRAGGPAGVNQLLAIVSDKPRNFAGIGMTAAGPFSVIGTTPIASRDIMLVSAGIAPAEIGSPQEECSMVGKNRTSEHAATCSGGYGADMLGLVEVY